MLKISVCFGAALLCLSCAQAQGVRGAAVHGVVETGYGVKLTGSRVSLMAVGLTIGVPDGDGGGSRRLGRTVVTDANGAFTLKGYHCHPADLVYVLAEGGHTPDRRSKEFDAGIVLISALGRCPAEGGQAPPDLVVNEVSTVGSVYSLGGFLRDGRHVMYSGSAKAYTGLMNAFAMRFNLVDPNGVARQTTLAGNGLLNDVGNYGLWGTGQIRINGLADVLYPCVSAGGGSPACTALFNAASPTTTRGCFGGKQPTDTVGVLRSILNQTSCNAAGLFALIGDPSPPYQPAVKTSPADWSVSVEYQTRLLNPYPVCCGLPISWYRPNFLAVDSQGNVWFTGMGTGLEKLGPQGQELMVVGDGRDPRYPTQLKRTLGVAIDARDNVWVTTYDGKFLSEFDPYGAPLSGASGYETTATLPGQTNGVLAIDSGGDVWLLTIDGYLCNYSGATGKQKCASSLSRTGAYNLAAQLPQDVGHGDTNSFGLTIDGGGRVWFGARGAVDSTPAAPVGAVGVLDPATNPPTLTPVSLPEANVWANPMFLAASRNGEIWVGNEHGGSSPTGNSSNLVAFRYDSASKSVTALKGSPIPSNSQSGVCYPRQGMFDGNDTFWVGNYTIPNALCGDSVSHLDVHGGGDSVGLGMVVDQLGLTEPMGIAVDGSGNLWVADGQGYFITELIGVAAPVVTPLNPEMLGHRP